MAIMANTIKEIRKNEGKENVLLLDAGDTFGDDQLANITRGAAIIQMMKLLEYDFMALGNHDFDYGRQRTKELQTLAGFAFGGANIIDKETGKTFLDHPFLIKEISGIKLGIIALGYHNSLLTGNKANMQGLNFVPGDKVLKKHLPLLSAKTDIIIILSHQGTAVDRITAKKFDDIDLIIGGHSHDIISGPEKINGTYLVQALSDAAVIGEVKLHLHNHKLQYAHAKSHLLWTDKHQADSKMQSLITSLRKPHLEELEEKITVAKETIGRQYKSESPCEKLIGNLLREHFNAEIAFLPGVGYGISLNGTVTSEDIYRLLPHPSKIVRLNLTGKQIKSILEQTDTNQKPGEKQEVVGGLLQSSGISYMLDYSQPSGNRIGEVKVNGKGLELHKKYKIVTHSGMLNGLHRYDVFQRGKKY
ncbi:5'-nucleotidase C-terminal domain-containing protein [Zunongwangia sp. SCSIO 43204]|uniref:bifunctional metallophosphatase/5'-nucleotidase n=1 Tax=Zunongwangia sp. SCSIO 43204 TaxID=2779359 RepID=UPI001CA9E208|nr:bifunctional UDP-sugar hydrolase/5'-nucleotidase [Zunongwangia sp. SCSIO 43204]UAB84400.1 5'-nucleotidase C-terminal domain-containing protein [Zunongwangia sp. SCSIO 43204]